MMFTEAQLLSFIEMYKKEFGEDIDRTEAQRSASALVSLVKTTYEPMTRSEYIEMIELAKTLGYGRM